MKKIILNGLMYPNQPFIRGNIVIIILNMLKVAKMNFKI